MCQVLPGKGKGKFGAGYLANSQNATNPNATSPNGVLKVNVF